MKKKEFLNMTPRKDENTDRLYDWIFVIPNGHKHESNWMCISIIGRWVEDGKELFEVCTNYADDINWLIPDSNRVNTRGTAYEMAHLRTDCSYPEGILKFWGRGKFQVGWSSSCEVRFIPNVYK